MNEKAMPNNSGEKKIFADQKNLKLIIGKIVLHNIVF